ncbi:hypothetical protein K437DRAFT_267231 [Tilletiaria anomala UBC 951]|uniref:Uncharacterized protein n=1 Tax=Tilletiaria anomala (strain ATCC 24038 / CBS 436.72 / UBC 951) TaxID=1037660 RepID=A0A066WAX2_TILAU|nr:uncharacterized protein K437DRAFT_267231 [Tilletiaria anomala UBC 951]KDN50851.1 hypothetical protein K437DRAFT_267231 [Tilletiaria anomala UBC 951]
MSAPSTAQLYASQQSVSSRPSGSLPLQPGGAPSSSAVRATNSRRPSFGAEKAGRMSPTASPPRSSSHLRSKFSTEALRSGHAPNISVPMPYMGNMPPPLPSPMSTGGAAIHMARTVSTESHASSQGRAGGPSGKDAGEKPQWYQRSKSSRNLAAQAAAQAAVTHANAPASPTESHRDREQEKDRDEDCDDSASISSFTCSSAREFDRQYKLLESLPTPMTVLAQTSTPGEAAAKGREYKQHWMDGLFGKLASKGMKKKKGTDSLTAGKGSAAGSSHFLDLSSFISPLPGANAVASAPEQSPPRPRMDHHVYSADAVPTIGSGAIPPFATPGRQRKAPRESEQQRSQSSMSFRSADEFSLSRRPSERSNGDLASPTFPLSPLPQGGARLTIGTKKSMDRLQQQLGQAYAQNESSGCQSGDGDVPALPSWAKESNRHRGMAPTSAATGRSQTDLQKSMHSSFPSGKAAVPMARAQSDSVQMQMGMQVKNAHSRPVLPARASSTSQAILGPAAASNLPSFYTNQSYRSDPTSRGSVSSISTDSTSSPQTPSSATPLNRILYGAGEADSPFPPMPLPHGGHYVHGSSVAGAAGVSAHHAIGSALMLSGVDDGAKPNEGERQSAILGGSLDEQGGRSPLMASRVLNGINMTPRAGRLGGEMARGDAVQLAEDGDMTFTRAATRTPGRGRGRAQTMASYATAPGHAWSGSVSSIHSVSANEMHRASISSRASATSSADERQSMSSDAFAYADRLSQASTFPNVSGVMLRREKLPSTAEEQTYWNTAF